jgi:putative DNA primase/helicase
MDDFSDSFRSAIFAVYGTAPEIIEAGRLIRFSRTGRRGDKSAWCRLFDDGDAGVFGDWRDGGHHHVWRRNGKGRRTPTELAMLSRQWESAKTQRRLQEARQWQEAERRNAQLWAACKAVAAGDPVARYLDRRVGLQARAVPACIRLHPALPYFDGGVVVKRGPAMVSALQGPDGRLLALHRTWLTHDGQKASVPGPVRKLTSGAGYVSGACIRLAWLTPGHGRRALGIAEGIETALAAGEASGLPTVAAYSAHNLAEWQWPIGLGALVIFADNDEAGQSAAMRLRRRAVEKGIAVSVKTPSTPGADWCDVWSQRVTVGGAA